MFLFVELDLILIAIGSLNLVVLLRLFVKFFPFIGCSNITAGLQNSLVDFGFESTLHLILSGLLFHFLSSHQFSPLLMLACLVKQVLTESDWAGGHFCLVMSCLVDFGFVGEIFVELFFRLVVLCFCATNKIIAVL